MRVITPIDGTPAEAAGVQAGDLIIRLDDKPVKGMTLRDAVRLMRGAPGTSAELTIMREGVERPLEFTVVRASIDVDSVKAERLRGGFGYLRVSQFQARTGEQLGDAIGRLQREHGAPLPGAVLDLRNNPGGVLGAAVEVADLFLDDGLVVYTEGRGLSTRQDFNSEAGDALQGRPLVVLVNAGSASAAEIVAGALQDRGRAIVMGSKTFGKGSVQTINRLSGGDAVKMTTARYYTPGGRSIQAEGIEPDVALQRVTVTAPEDGNEFRPYSEADLAGRLNNTDVRQQGRPSLAGRRIDPTQDYPLFEAVSLLRALALTQNTGTSAAPTPAP